MKLVILAGGFGTRMPEYTKTIPKPMVRVNKLPIIQHIINHYLKFGIKQFYIALGYKKEIIKKYFKNKKLNYEIHLVDTGLKTMTGGRIKRIKKFLDKNEDFMLTYGDGISNVNIKKLYNLHKKNRSLVTLTAVRPPARFGALRLLGNKVKYFKEKSKVDEGWINGGFFIMNEKFINYIKSDKTYLEREPLEKATKLNQLSAYKHFGFWQCIDTKRDKDRVEKLLKKKKF
tara:strand:- start:1171 stop:1860 length:690 start_codon:yes stop_codon:yes gene_type:complete